MPMKTAQTKSPIVRNLVGGLNVREAITDLADNEGAAASNVVYYTAGALARRGGWQKLIANSPTTKQLLGAYQAVFNSAGVFTYYLVVTDGTDIWQTSNPTAASVTWTKITGAVTLDASQPYHFLMMANKMVGYNGKAAFYWTGSGNISSFPAPGSGQIAVPLSRVGIVWQNYLFWGGDGTNPARWYFSDLGDPTVYPSANYIDVPNPFDGDQITGAAILYGNLLTLKRLSVHVIQGAPPSNLIQSKLNASVGCVDPASVVQVDNLVYFVSDKGLYAINLFNDRQVCFKVEPRYLAAVPYSSAAAPIWAAHYKPRNHIFVALNCRPLYAPSIGYNDRILAHDYFNADQNGDPAVSEFIVGFTAYGLSATRPAYPTAPSIMGDYLYNASPSKPATVMASFYDQWVYVFSEGSLAYGGPPDAVSWLSAAAFPPADFLSKFFDFGDPDMIKQVRWLWTTGQLYNSQNLQAGIVYNNSPTVVSFIDFNTGIIELQSPNGNKWLLGVDDDGALTLTPTSDATFLTTLVIQDSAGKNWNFGVDNDGAPNIAQTTASPNTPPVLASTGGFQYQLTVDTDGAYRTTPAFAPDVAAIVPGARVAVAPLVNGVGGAKQGKYIQLYFTGIGILSQFSMDLILKGRRN